MLTNDDETSDGAANNETLIYPAEVQKAIDEVYCNIFSITYKILFLIFFYYYYL